MPTTNQPETTVASPAVQQGVAVAYALPATTNASPKKKKVSANVWAAHLALWGICACAIVPFLWMLSTSLKTADQSVAYPPQWWPSPIRWQNYRDLFCYFGPDLKWHLSTKFQFLLWTRNTLIIEVLSVSGTVISSAIVAYGFAKIKFKGRGIFFALMLSSMMIPFPVTMVSLFSMYRWLGDHTPITWLGTFKPLWVPAWFGAAFNIFLLRQFFLTVPEELSEAARIDGCSEIGIFFRVILPLSRPALTVVALFAFMGTWNDYLGPLIYLQRPEQFTLALGLQNLQSQHGGTPWHTLMAASMLVILPVLVLFFLAQKTFIEGIATTGMKG